MFAAPIGFFTVSLHVIASVALGVPLMTFIYKVPFTVILYKPASFGLLDFTMKLGGNYLILMKLGKGDPSERVAE